MPRRASRGNVTGIFISYRRQESAGHAGRLRDHLRQRFGDIVFQDVDDIPPGEDFEHVLDRALKACQVAVIVIGRNWASCTDPAGHRRLGDPEDWVRIETRQLLERDIRVFPVLVGGATMPGSKDLPEELQGLAKRNALQLHDTSWDYNVRILSDQIEKVLKPGGRSRRTLWMAMAGVGILVLAGAWLALRGTDSGEGLVPTTPGPVAPATGPKPAPSDNAASAPGSAPTPATTRPDSTLAAAQALGVTGTTWRMEDFSGFERPAGSATTYTFKVVDGALWLEPVDGSVSNRMVVRQIQERAITLLPKPADGKAFEFMYVFELAPDGGKLDPCRTVRAADFAALGPCQWRYHRVAPGAARQASTRAVTPQACGGASLTGAVDPACQSAARAADLIGNWRAGDGGAAYRFGLEGNAVRLSSTALKNEAPWRLAIRSVKDGVVTLAWAGFLGKADNFDAQNWYEYDLTADGSRLVKCRAVTQLSASQDVSQCADVPPFLIRER